ncbi:hypothetical protein NPIL_152861 [Nephila pilipes]|uniref:Uncharacterized protein n=1 Tax=Nephila pilipes TaxID=299642 RepID=A0A8X6QRK1_NEPPI|nr:hypothetical protein NPIL_152861 [Nephila pilipes]
MGGLPQPFGGRGPQKTVSPPFRRYEEQAHLGSQAPIVPLWVLRGASNGSAELRGGKGGFMVRWVEETFDFAKKEGFKRGTYLGGESRLASRV